MIYMGFYKVRRDDYLEHFGFKKQLKVQGDYMIEYDDRYLAHHGVKGQKWGIRKKNRYEKKNNS